MNLLKNLKNKNLFFYFRKLKKLEKFFAEKKNKKILAKSSGIYFGEEFCEFLVPSANIVKKAYTASRNIGKTFSFITTVASPKLINSYKKIFNFLNKQGKIEVIVNDWGILHLLTQQFKNIEPVLGRMLTKTKRYIYKDFTPDKEGLPLKDTSTIKRNQLRVLRETNFSIKEYRQFLKSYSIKKVDIDIPPQGIKIDGFLEFNFGFYYPWGYLTSGRSCPYNPKAKFYVSSAACEKKYCLRNSSLIKSKKWNTNLFEIGNTILYKVNVKKIPDFAKRIIYQLDFPKTDT
ncbi:MAG: hypothetical protein K9L76_01390 [Candidatus Omnitrophica bacterium]|nr:hypothetical protein [Candidatus Omnitrophota bacterium]